ncbi:Hypothetical protein NTJ_10232 [Nesidiocoris tenuis]|uniref:Uncharacterized protein n=1 Tax=Nesidiocoris tenuis TaxID=355587 RepID=A0ABN7AZL9_9HEMI|nr:Hypothetical protein NTJ_10232 [Nesidiocoris tenuis]
MSNDPALMRKRRRSSVFGDNVAVNIHDPLEENRRAEIKQDDVKSEEVKKIEEYVGNLKKCKMQWLTYVNKLKKEVEACKAERDTKLYQEVSENFMDYLNPSDRDFMAWLNGPKSYPSNSDVDSLLRRLQIANYRCEQLLQQYELLCVNVEEACSVIESRMIPALSATPQFIRELDQLMLELGESAASDGTPRILN